MCLDYVKLSSYIDGILLDDEKHVIDMHLQSCQKCMTAYKNYKTMIRSIGNLNQPKVPDNFVDSVFLRIDSIVHPSFVELSTYRDGLVEDKIIEEHILDCIPCQDTIDSINNEVMSVSALSEYQPSEDFFESLMGKIDELDTINTEFVDSDDDFLSGIMAQIDESPEPETEENHIAFDDLSAYIDNEETSVSVFEIEKHLEECAKCNSKVASFRLTKTTIAELDNPPVPFDFSKKVIKEIENNDNKVIRFMPYFKKFAPRASMVAGIIIAGILVTVSRTQIDPPQEQMANITVRSEDYLFSNSPVSYRTDSLDVLVDNRQDDSLQIEDIGL